MTSTTKPLGDDGGSQQQVFESWQKGDPNRFGHQTSICWIVLTAVARRRRLSCSQPASPKTVKAAASQPLRARVPNRGSVGSGGNLSQQLPAVVTEPSPFRPHSDESGPAIPWRVGRHQSPPPLHRQKKSKSHLDRSACLPKTQTLKPPLALPVWPEKHDRRPANTPPACAPPPASLDSGGLPSLWPCGAPL